MTVAAFKIKWQLAASGWTQRDLAKVLRIHHVYLNALLCGRRKPGPKTHKALRHRVPGLEISDWDKQWRGQKTRQPRRGR